MNLSNAGESRAFEDLLFRLLDVKNGISHIGNACRRIMEYA